MILLNLELVIARGEGALVMVVLGDDVGDAFFALVDAYFLLFPGEREDESRCGVGRNGGRVGVSVLRRVGQGGDVAVIALPIAPYESVDAFVGGFHVRKLSADTWL